ncbi:MAG: UDP-N-acetylmuramate--L-alanine ligase [Parachlamydia sp.]|jgi:UDP-N-acetylmuramate--alanine ligase|nr:UDP-N-acetylmuramate--L-alanine ligase [Parachlamydia sp.]
MIKEHYHFIGIGGIGMSGLAHLLLGLHKTVSGSDIASNALIEQLAQKGAQIYPRHSEKNIIPHCTVIYSTDIKKDNPEFEAAKRLGCTLFHRSELLSRLIEKKYSLAVAGTHGKTTTSGLLTAVLAENGGDPSFAIGGVISQFNTNAHLGKGNFFVLEADESDKSFLNYYPDGAIITNIDNDHMPTYGGSFERLKEAFSHFTSQVKTHLFWCGDDPFLCKIVNKGQSFGFGSHCNWKIDNHRQEGFQQFFDLTLQNQHFPSLQLNLIGRHNVLNAAAVFAMAYTVGQSEEAIRKAFIHFKGVGRRCEKKGLINDILFIDDYAHHPTEIATTLAGIRKAIGPKKLWAVYQPHRFTRTRDCLGQFGAIFDTADQVIVTDIYGGGEAPVPDLTASLIVEEIQATMGDRVQYLPRTALGHYLSRINERDAVIVTLGAGDVTKVAGEAMALMEIHA